jgi:hypothetical protein
MQRHRSVSRERNNASDAFCYERIAMNAQYVNNQNALRRFQISNDYTGANEDPCVIGRMMRRSSSSFIEDVKKPRLDRRHQLVLLAVYFVVVLNSVCLFVWISDRLISSHDAIVASRENWLKNISIAPDVERKLNGLKDEYDEHWSIIGGIPSKDKISIFLLGYLAIHICGSTRGRDLYPEHSAFNSFITDLGIRLFDSLGLEDEKRNDCLRLVSDCLSWCLASWRRLAFVFILIALSTGTVLSCLVTSASFFWLWQSDYASEDTLRNCAKKEWTIGTLLVVFWLFDGRSRSYGDNPGCIFSSTAASLSSTSWNPTTAYECTKAYELKNLLMKRAGVIPDLSGPRWAWSGQLATFSRLKFNPLDPMATIAIPLLLLALGAKSPSLRQVGLAAWIACLCCWTTLPPLQCGVLVLETLLAMLAFVEIGKNFTRWLIEYFEDAPEEGEQQKIGLEKLMLLMVEDKVDAASSCLFFIGTVELVAALCVHYVVPICLSLSLEAEFTTRFEFDEKQVSRSPAQMASDKY